MYISSHSWVVINLESTKSYSISYTSSAESKYYHSPAFTLLYKSTLLHTHTNPVIPKQPPSAKPQRHTSAPSRIAAACSFTFNSPTTLRWSRSQTLPLIPTSNTAISTGLGPSSWRFASRSERMVRHGPDPDPLFRSVVLRPWAVPSEHTLMSPLNVTSVCAV